ncbi:MAG: DUF4221 domain-containing protein [Bacteroidales bacterium]|nr:DUF4221 domain-containing protein [Bacteroidales bacterium]
MKKLLLLIICFTVLLFACNNQDKTELNLSFQIDTLKINTQENSLSITDAPNIYYRNGTEYYTNYNEAFNTLIFFDLNKFDFDRKIQFKKSGPGKLSVCDDYIIHKDTLLVFTTFYVKFYNLSGDHIKTLQLKDICPPIATQYRLARAGISISNILKTNIDSKNNSLLLRTFRNGLPYEDGFYDNPVLCEYSLNSQKADVIPITYPQEVYSKYFYDDLATPHFVAKGDSIIYHCHFKSLLYVYNRKTKKTKEIKFDANHLPNLINGKIRKKVSGITHMALNDRYHNLTYDKYRNIFYLAYNKKAKDIETYHLIVFDNKLNKLGEITLPLGYSQCFAISKKGLLFRNTEDLAYYHFNLYVVKIDLPKN